MSASSPAPEVLGEGSRHRFSPARTYRSLHPVTASRNFHCPIGGKLEGADQEKEPCPVQKKQPGFLMPPASSPVDPRLARPSDVMCISPQ